MGISTGQIRRRWLGIPLHQFNFIFSKTSNEQCSATSLGLVFFFLLFPPENADDFRRVGAATRSRSGEVPANRLHLRLLRFPSAGGGCRRHRLQITHVSCERRRGQRRERADQHRAAGKSTRCTRECKPVGKRRSAHLRRVTLRSAHVSHRLKRSPLPTSS